MPQMPARQVILPRKREPIACDRKLRLHKFYNLGGTIKNFSNFSDFDLKNNGSGFILLQGVCGKEFLFTAAKIKATRGKGTDFYQQHLSNNDYYSEHDRVVGVWSGSLAEKFGLQGETVDPAVFSLFQQNLNPVDHSKLTPRNNPHSVRFYDFQCSAQKSVSVMSMFDPRLAEAHRRAVKVGMAELEKFAAVRIRKGDNYATKNFAFTGKFIYAEYHHDNSRLLDPQLHTHNVIVNVTQDSDGTFKALDSTQMYQAIRYAGKSYQNALARECIRLGYELDIKRSDKGEITGFEIKGIDEEILKRCSRRRHQIDKAIEEFVAKKGRQPTAEEVKTMTLLTRNRKMLEKSETEVEAFKRSLLTAPERQRLYVLAENARIMGDLRFMDVEEQDAVQQISKVAAQLFERHSVLKLDALLAEVQNQHLGETDLEVLQTALQSVPGLVNLKSPAGNPYFTTEENLQRENYAIETVNNTKGLLPDLTSSYRPFSEVEDTYDHSAQIKVINDILESKDPFMVFRGVAGAGKTSTLQELCKCLKKGGIENIHVVAPTNSAVDVLRSENFESAQTVAMFLQNKDKLPPQGSYLIIDESGLNSLRQGTEMMKLAMENNYRVLFVGDERQHSSVEAGDFFRLLENHSMIKKTMLAEIHRQQQQEYRRGIEYIATGSSKEGFEHLDAHGFIHEDQADYLERAAEDFVRLTDNGKRPLDCIAVSPTHRECDILTGMIREKMKSAGCIKGDENNLVESFHSWNWTKPQLGDIGNYQVGSKIFFNTRIKGIASAGEMATVEKIEDGKLVLSNGVTVSPQTIKHGIDVGNSVQLPVGAGDIVRFTVNLRTPEYKINNGSLAIATGNPNEYCLLDSSRKELTTIRLPENFKGIKYGWVMTSHASQGMTSKNVVVAAEKMSKQAFYVACSRGKFNLALHIPDKEFFKNKLLHLRTERLSVHDLSASGEIIAPVLPSAEEIRQNCRPVPEELMRKHNENVLIRMLKRIVQKVSGLFGGSPYNSPQAVAEYRKGQVLQMTVDNATEKINRKGEDHEQTIRPDNIKQSITEERPERKITDNPARVPGTSKPPRKPGPGRGID